MLIGLANLVPKLRAGTEPGLSSEGITILPAYISCHLINMEELGKKPTAYSYWLLPAKIRVHLMMVKGMNVLVP